MTKGILYLLLGYTFVGLVYGKSMRVIATEKPMAIPADSMKLVVGEYLHSVDSLYEAARSDGAPVTTGLEYATHRAGMVIWSSLYARSDAGLQLVMLAHEAEPFPRITLIVDTASTYPHVDAYFHFRSVTEVVRYFPIRAPWTKYYLEVSIWLRPPFEIVTEGWDSAKFSHFTLLRRPLVDVLPLRASVLRSERRMLELLGSSVPESYRQEPVKIVIFDNDSINALASGLLKSSLKDSLAVYEYYAPPPWILVRDTEYIAPDLATHFIFAVNPVETPYGRQPLVNAVVCSGFAGIFNSRHDQKSELISFLQKIYPANLMNAEQPTGAERGGLGITECCYVLAHGTKEQFKNFIVASKTYQSSLQYIIDTFKIPESEISKTLYDFAKEYLNSLFMDAPLMIDR